MVDYPTRGQQSPNYWDGQLKSYIDSSYWAAPDFPDGPVEGQTWVQSQPGGLIAPQFSDHFKSGDATAWTFSVGATFNQSYAFTGPSGCRLTGAGAHAYLSVGSTKLAQGNPWITGSFTFRLVAPPGPANTDIILMEALTSLASGTKDQYDLWLGKNGNLWINFADSNNLIIDTKPEVGVWHTLDFCIDYGDPYLARTRYDGRRVADIGEPAPQGATTAATFYCGSQAAAPTFTVDVGDVSLATSASDPGFLFPGSPVLRQYLGGVWH